MSMNQSKEITDGLRQLCDVILGDNVPQDEMRLRFSQSVQLVTNPVFAAEQWDEGKLVDSIVKRLAKAGKQNSAIQFSRLCGRIREKDLLKNRAGILKFLLSLNQQGRRKDTDQSLFRSRGSTGTDPGSPSVGRVRQQKRQLVPEANAESYGSSANRPAGWKATGIKTSTTVVDEFRPVDYGLGLSGQQQRPTRNPLTARQAFDADSLPTPDSALLRDVIFALQGIDGQYFHYNTKNESFQLLSSTNIRSPKRELLLRIAEIGWLHGHVKDYCSQQYDRGGGYPGGLIVQAFRSALREDLSDFYKQLAILQTEISNSSTTLDQGISSPTSEVNGFCTSSSFSARRLHVSLNGWKQKLITLTTIVDTCGDYHGGALLSRLYEACDHGDPDWRQVAMKLLGVTCQPLLAYILKWIREGALDDRAEEFFISCDDDVEDEAGVWTNKYILRGEMIPSFLSESFTKTVLLAGKSLNCIRYILRDPDAMEMIPADQHQFGHFEGSFPMDAQSMAELSQLVNQTRDTASQRLTYLMNSQFLLSTHLGAMKKYLLLSQGDFAWHLMDVLGPELDKPVEMVHLHNLSSCLDLVIRQTNSQLESSSVLDCMHVEVLDTPRSEGLCDTSKGWDIFSLKYRISGPLTIVVSEDCSVFYSRLFDFSWRLKCLSFSLTALWHQLMSVSKTWKKCGSIIQPFHLACGEVSRFVECMQYYFFFQVLECGWHSLADKLNSSDLDVIITSHKNYLDELLRKSFQLDQYSLFSQKFFLILGLVSQFKSRCGDFLNSIDSGRFRGNEGRKQQPDSILHGKTSRDLKQLLDQYRAAVKDFVHSLLDQSDDELRALGLRLDFNGFYTESGY